MIYIGTDKASNQVELSTISEKAVKTHTHTHRTSILPHNENHIFYVCLIFYVRHALENSNI